MIEGLDNNEQVLLMYLAGELSPEDQQEVQRMLDADPSLRLELQRLEATWATVFDGLEKLDNRSSLSGQDARLWRVVQQMRQRLAERARPTEAPVAQRAPRSFRWMYRVAAAAAIIAAAGIWISRHQNQTVRRPISRQFVVQDPDEDLFEDSFPEHEDAQVLAFSNSRAERASDDDLSRLLLSEND